MQYALCPFCLSTLQITEEQLAAKGGLVRCGHCQDIFDANKNKLTSSSEPTALNEAVEQTNQSIPLKTEQSPKDNNIPIIASWETPKAQPQHKRPFALLSFLSLLLLIAQFTYFEAELFTQNEKLQPFLKRFNQTYNLHIPRYKNLDQIHIIQRQIGKHPELADVLVLQLTIKNSALAEQAFPAISITLTSHGGDKIAQGVFTKYDYLKPSETNNYFAAQAFQEVNLAFNNPHQEASGFEIAFQ